MNPYTYKKRANTVLNAKSQDKNILNLVFSVFTSKINMALAVMVLMFAAWSVMIISAMVAQEIAIGDYEPVRHNLRSNTTKVLSYSLDTKQAEVLGVTVYDKNLITSPGNKSMKIYVQPNEYISSSDKWSYNISWSRTKNATGSLYAGGVKVADPASQAGTEKVELAPRSRVKVEFYSQPNKKGTLLVRKYFNVKEKLAEGGRFCAMDAKLCPDGTYVLRVAPSCEFAACPGEISANPTAQLLANGKIDITVNPGDTINYAWTSTGFDRFSSSYTGDKGDTCFGGITEAVKSKEWVAKNANGALSAKVEECQAGVNYTIAYKAESSSGRWPAQTKNVIVRVNSLSASNSAFFRANDKTELTVNVGDKIRYEWSAPGYAVYSSGYTADKSDSCTGGIGANMENPWVAKTASGSYEAVVQPCQAGVTYAIQYRAVKTGASPLYQNVFIKVNPLPASFTVNGSTSIITTVGSTLNYVWDLSGYDSIKSSYTANKADACYGGVAFAGQPKDWVAKTPTGSVAATVAGCQRGVLYTNTITGVKGSETISKIITVYVRE